MRLSKLPSRLVAGLAGLATLSLACLLGPWLLPQPPPSDPAHAALLPPGTLVTAITLTSGAVVVAPEVAVTTESLIVGDREDVVELASEQVRTTRTHRLWLGSDRFGRDVLWHLLRGGRLSLLIAALSAGLALAIGGAVGLAAASGGKLVDAILMRLVDALLAFPVLVLMILVATLVRPGATVLVVVLGLTSWMSLARLVRGQVLSLRAQPFVLAARTAGSRWHRIWSLHYLPNMVGPLSQDTALRLGDLVLAEATLSYLGLGIPPTVPTWGSMVAEGHTVMLDGWWLAAVPGLAIVLLVVSLALVGDGLQQLVAD